MIFSRGLHSPFRLKTPTPVVAALCVLSACWAGTPFASAMASTAPATAAGPASALAADVQAFDSAALEALVLRFNPLLMATAQSVDAARASVTTAGALPNPRVEWSRGPWQALGAGSASSQSCPSG